MTERAFVGLQVGAAYLGISTSSLRRLIKAGHIKAYRLTPGNERGRLGVRVSDLDTWASTREVVGVAQQEDAKAVHLVRLLQVVRKLQEARAKS